MDWTELLTAAIAGAILAIVEITRRRTNAILRDVRNGHDQEPKRKAPSN